MAVSRWQPYASSPPPCALTRSGASTRARKAPTKAAIKTAHILLVNDFCTIILPNCENSVSRDYRSSLSFRQEKGAHARLISGFRVPTALSRGHGPGELRSRSLSVVGRLRSSKLCGRLGWSTIVQRASNTSGTVARCLRGREPVELIVLCRRE